MKNLRITLLFFLSIISIISCGESKQNDNSDTDENTSDEISKRGDSHVNYIFSLYKTTNKSGYQIYRNNEKFSSFNISKDSKPLAMKIFAGDCYILISNSLNDSAKYSAQILRNGKAAMEFQPEFIASDFDVNKGHFYVLGNFGDTLISIYKDGIRYYDFEKNNKKPGKVCVYNEEIYYTLFQNNETEVYKERKLLFSIPGEIDNFEISALGIYSLANNKIYRNEKQYMEGGNHYVFFDNDLIAYPVCVSVSDKYCFAGIKGEFTDNKQYASIFQDREHYITIKPDDKPLGKSSFQTRCCGVSTCINGAYYITQNIMPEIDSSENIYHYYFNSNEVFTIEPTAAKAELLFVKAI